MSVLVKGMELPGRGWDCPLNTFGVCNAPDVSPYDYDCGEIRPDWCPLVEVPTPPKKAEE